MLSQPKIQSDENLDWDEKEEQMNMRFGHGQTLKTNDTWQSGYTQSGTSEFSLNTPS